ncbi:L-asparaginase 3 [Fusarium albosuccineum]|uniref:L-asparaginase 3 n=1 Tax=Fusarium albosuccineum TaxID=1237068 RepID=A0A8H4LM80_9HYPO|nr:L-asparaginase 3 [Fusarium albosuccineum]
MDYRRHAPSIRKAWRSFDNEQRVKCLTSSVHKGVALKHLWGMSWAKIYIIALEIDLQNVIEGGEGILDRFEHRATKSLEQQFRKGVHDNPYNHTSDYDKIPVTDLRNFD